MENRLMRLLTTGIIALIFGIILNFFTMPAWNIRSVGIWWFFLFITVIATIASAFLDNYAKEDFKNTAVFGIIIGIISAVIIFGGLTSAKAFNVDRYHNLISVSNSDFSSDIPIISDETPISIVDVETAQHLGDRTIGGIANAPWYEVANEYNLINYQGKYFRISDLEYGDLFKYGKAKEVGIPGYVLVDAENQTAEYIEFENPMKYSPSAHFSKLLKRHLRNLYPSYIFDKTFFEVDDEGQPYFITGIVRPTIGLFGGRIVENFIITDPITGECIEYKSLELPKWVDHAYSISYMMEVTNHHFSLINGWWNSWLSKTGVNKTTYEFKTDSFAGYNSTITSNGEVVFFSGVTPASNAETNIGFILANPHTGKITYYSCAGAEESSAQSAAEGLVSNMGYVATFPTIINVDGIETYFMLLKDKAGLVQRYSLCNIKDYTKVVEATTLEEALEMYRIKLSGSSIISSAKAENIEGNIEQLYQAEIDGYTYYYFTLKGSNNLYMSSITNSNRQVLLKVGTKVNIDYVASSEEGVYIVNKINF